MSDFKILKVDHGATGEVRDFSLPDFHRGQKTFTTPTAVRTFSHGKPALPKGGAPNRFEVDPLLKGLVSSDEEAELAIAERVRDEIAGLRERVIADSHAKGHAEGYEEGLRRAKEESDARLNPLVARWEAFVTAAEGTKADLLAAHERFLVEALASMAKSVLRKEIATDRDYLKRLVRSVVEEVGAKEMIHVRVSAAQLGTIMELRPELENKYASLKNLSFDSSEDLQDSDCVIETDWSRVDATFDTQIENLRRLLVDQVTDGKGEIT